jgi:hypothetical protein
MSNESSAFEPAKYPIGWLLGDPGVGAESPRIGPSQAIEYTKRLAKEPAEIRIARVAQKIERY